MTEYEKFFSSFMEQDYQISYTSPEVQEEGRMFNTVVASLLAAASPSFGQMKAHSNQPITQPAETQKHLDTIVVAKTIYAEARGEGANGMRAVATVIWNRAGKDPKRLASVCKEPYQFSCWNGRKDIDIKEPALFKVCLRVAQSMMNGTFVPFEFKGVDPTHYCTRKLYLNNPPKYAIGRKIVQVGRHVFFQA